MPVKKMLIAHYSLQNVFKIPDDIDLTADGVEYGVRYNTLYITLPNGKNVEIEGGFNVTDINVADFERPNEIEIEDNDPDMGWEKEEGQDCRGCGEFLPDGQECVPPESAHAYCENCFEKLNAKPKRKLRIKK